jgi:hypothetical protein
MAARTHSNNIPMPTVKEVEDARRTFLVGEPRYLFYKVAIEMIDPARIDPNRVSVAQALAVLLQTWNVSFYRFRGGFTEEDLTNIKALLIDHHAMIEEYRERSIASLASGDEDALRILFSHFKAVLGPVGAAKSLHLLAPLFFPLWDNAIARAYRVKFGHKAPEGYIRFMHISKEQCRVLAEQGALWPDPLKAVDEYNYCRYVLDPKN